MVNRAAFGRNRRVPISGLSDLEYERRLDPESVEHRELMDTIRELIESNRALVLELQMSRTK